MPLAASYPVEITGNENHPELQVSDEVFSQIAVDITAFGLGLREKWKREAELIHRKRRGPPTPDLVAETSRWKVERRDPSKRRRTMGSEQTGIRLAARMGENPELPVRGTPGLAKEISKLSRHGLDMEVPVALPQGVSPPLDLGPTISVGNPGSHEHGFQARSEEESGSDSRGFAGIEDSHDDKEGDKERWARLMLYEDGKWKCKGPSCSGQVFFDRSTLQRHCRGSAAHAKLRDLRKCPLCPKQYPRLSGVSRHMKAKHPEEWGRRRESR